MKVASNERGTSLVETMIAVLIAMIGVFGLGSLIFQATATNKNQGAETTRATIYAQDKLEKLLSLGASGPLGQIGVSPNLAANFNNCTATGTAQDAQTGKPCNSTGITDNGWTTGLLQGGVLSPLQASCPSAGSPTIGYVDFLNASGVQLPVNVSGVSTPGPCTNITNSDIAYIRMWQITDLASTGGPALKNITVAVYSQLAVNTAGGKPVVVLTSLLTNPN